MSLKEMLELNDIDVGARPREALVIVSIDVFDHVLTVKEKCAEGIAFGRLGNCSECKDRKWLIKTEGFFLKNRSLFILRGYSCRGSMSEWEPCTNITKTPKIEHWLFI